MGVVSTQEEQCGSPFRVFLILHTQNERTTFSRHHLLLALSLICFKSAMRLRGGRRDLPRTAVGRMGKETLEKIASS